MYVSLFMQKELFAKFIKICFLKLLRKTDAFSEAGEIFNSSRVTFDDSTDEHSGDATLQDTLHSRNLLHISDTMSCSQHTHDMHDMHGMHDMRALRG